MSDFPNRVIVGANGAYWRDYGDHLSMCPVSTDNDPVVAAAVYVLAYPVRTMPDGFVLCPLCNQPEAVEDVVGGVCLTCADGIAFSQNARRGSIVVEVKE